MNDASSLDDASKQLNRIWDPEDYIFAAYTHPLHEADGGLLYLQELKNLLRKHTADSIIINVKHISTLQENVSLNAEAVRIEKLMTSQTLMHAEETCLWEEPTYECLSQLEDQRERN